MDLELLKQLTKEPESNKLEFKKTTGLLQEAFETLCGFLNGNGGTVLIGVGDDGKIVGQEVADKTRKEISNEIKKIEPPANIDIEYVSIGSNKQVVALQVKSGNHRPYAYRGRPYQRLEATTELMPQHRYDQLLLERNQFNYSWEKSIAQKYDIKLLDHNLILSTIRGAVENKRLPESAIKQDIPKILESLELMENSDIKNAAVVLFGTKFPADFYQCQLQLARFIGVTRSEFLDSNNEFGNIFDLLDSGMLFVRRHIPVAAKIEAGKMERVETPIIPFDAIREALINALAHRDYSIAGSSIKLAIYDDRMEISSHGGLPVGVTLERIIAGYSKPRNPVIAEVLYKAGLIEKWGRGIQEMISKCKSAGDPLPEFIVDELEFKVVFRFPKSLKPMVVTEGEELILTEDGERIEIELSERQKNILKILASGTKFKLKEILAQLPDHPAERTLRDDLAYLRKHGLVESKGSTKTTIWSIKK